MTSEQILQIWKEAAKQHGYVLNKKPELVEKAAKLCALVVKGACICKPNDRPKCPCDDMHKEIKEVGYCFCRVFFDPNAQVESG